MAELLPLLAEQSIQAQVLIPLAISLIFDLLASTFLVLIVIPCLYLLTGMTEARRVKQWEKNRGQANLDTVLA